MILSTGPGNPQVSDALGTPTLDGLVREHARLAPDRLAVIDAPDRPLWSDGAPRRLSWAQLEAAVAGVARRLAELGLSADTPVAIQGPNATDTLLAILAALRAGLIPIVLPAGWRRREVAAAVERTGVRAILTVTRAGPVLPADQLRYVAAEAFGIRFVCSFGAEVPDGVISLEECLTGAVSDFDTPWRGGEPADHLALVSWDCSAAGFFPVARSHAEVLASAVPEPLPGEATLLSSYSPCGLAAWATTLAPWLLAGASLVLHQGFDATVLGVQLDRHAVTHLVLPDIVAEAVLAELTLPAGLDLLQIVRRPDLPVTAATRADVHLRTAIVLGELAVFEPRTGNRGELLLGSGSIETRLGASGLLEVRGPMVPRAGFGSRQRPPYPVDDDGWVGTGFPAGLEGGRLAMTGPRADVVSIGGHAMALADVDALYADAPGAQAVNAVALPSPILGQQLGLSAMPDPDSRLSASSLVLHAEENGASPLAMSADVELGDRRAPPPEANRLAGAA